MNLENHFHAVYYQFVVSDQLSATTVSNKFIIVLSVAVCVSCRAVQLYLAPLALMHMPLIWGILAIALQ